jgi:hypothetical protein
MVPGNFPEDRGNEALAIVDQLREIEAKSGERRLQDEIRNNPWRPRGPRPRPSVTLGHGGHHPLRPWREAETYRAWYSGNLTGPGAAELLAKLEALPEPEIEIGVARLEAARRAYEQAGARLRAMEAAHSQRDRLVSVWLEAMFEEAEMEDRDARRRQRG